MIPPKDARVRFSKAGRKALWKNSRAHYLEFKNLNGVTIGYDSGPNGEPWPEIRVLWGNTGLRYSYPPEYLELVPSTVLLTIGRDAQLRMTIDHQTFTIAVPEDHELGKRGAAQWYRKQLKVALERLARQGL